MSKRHIVENHMSRLISHTRSNEEKGLLDIFYAHDKYHNNLFQPNVRFCGSSAHNALLAYRKDF